MEPDRARALRRLPPLAALRAFEVVARCGSIAAAADELLVTPAAVKHQVRQLEGVMGIRLFNRAGRGLILTDAGLALLPGIREGFDRLIEAVYGRPENVPAGEVRVSVAPSFAAKWLLPRLARFAERWPLIDVRVEASERLVAFPSPTIDLAIRYGAGRAPGLHVERLLDESVVPVAAPELVQRRALASPADLAGVSLLHDDSVADDPTCPDWSMWLKAAHVADVDGTRGPRFTQSALAIDAAAQGLGVALAKKRLAAGDIASGRLAALFDSHVDLAFAYYLVVPAANLDLARVRAFATWLREEAAKAT
ncbi:transcriptional regulator GcvA [Zavarzinia sp. CC-PAN008]|uniref:transcriptional regulator GcvA n=1 Tax=Zavarzinia sp. CC-PAN008 TaxID=3243332 RepID=UPI003F74651D